MDKTRRRDGGGYELRYLESLSKELDSEDAPLRLSNSLLEQALMEAGAYTSKAAPLDYLLPAWKRVCKQLRSMKSKVSNEKLEIVKEARRLCMSYCIFAATMPDMFGNSREGNPLVPHLLLDQDNDKGIDHEFLTELISRFSDEDASAQDAIILAVEELSQQLATRTMNDDYKPHVLALRNLVRYAGIVNAIVQSPRFLPETTAEKLEVDSILGPFFALSPLQGNVTLNYFSSPKTRDKNYIVSSQNALRMTARAHQADLLDIANHIIKTGKEPREKTLDWFASCVNLNHKRRAMQVDKKTVSSDAFMVNVTVCLDQLCEPFMDATFSKIDRIDANYLRRNPRVDIKEETKLNADQNASDEFYSTTADGQSNFISEVFFLALAAHHYGTEATHAMLSQLERELKHMEKQLGVLEADREKLAHAPMQLAMVDRALQKYREQVDKGLAYKFSAQGVLLDDLNQTRSMQFMRYVIVWLLRLVQPEHEYPKRPLTAPLPETLSQVFNCLPEYFLEDVVSNFKFIMRNMPQIITTTQSDELVTLCITFLRSSKYIKNPYLKAGLVTILFHGTWPTYGRAKGVLGDILNGNPFALEHLLHSLMKFYIEIETTGAHTQFYDKFNIRYEIFQIIKTIWGNTVYQERLAAESRGNLEFFVRFVNLLLNDVTYVLDESLSAFKKIHELQQLLKPDNAEGDALGEEARRDKEELLSEAENKAKNYMQLANETMAMLKLFTAALADSFTKPEVVQRLADMLDYNLDLMVGPKSSQLRVERPEDYGFNPRVLLSEIVDVFLNLGSKETFVVAVARDGRSYKPANLNKATQILKRWGLKSAQELDEWAKLGERFAKAKDMETQDEALFEDAPDEFNGTSTPPPRSA